VAEFSIQGKPYEGILCVIDDHRVKRSTGC
jgi:hypothetical protein